jgi:hypothetical protein
MTDPDYCPVRDDDLGRYSVPFLCFLYRFANDGHAFEASIGIPSWMSWFSTPDLALLQIFEAGLLLMILSLFILVLSADMLESRGWDWKTNVRVFGAAALLGWLEMCLVSSSHLSGKKHTGQGWRNRLLDARRGP